MISSGSESDEDCYGNIAGKLQSLKKNIRDNDKTAINAKIERALSVDHWSPVAVADNSSATGDFSLLEDLSLVPDLPTVKTLPSSTGVSTSPKKRVTRRSTRLSNSLSDLSNGPSSKRGRKKTAARTSSIVSLGITPPAVTPSGAIPPAAAPSVTIPPAAAPSVTIPPAAAPSVTIPPAAAPSVAKRPAAAPSAAIPPTATPLVPDAATIPGPSRRGRKKKSAATPLPVTAPTVTPAAVVSPPAVVAPPVVTPTRGRGGRGARGSRGGRGRSWSRGRRSRSSWAFMNFDPIVYSVGNTHEYPDSAENIPLFSQKTTVANDPDLSIVEVADLSSSFTEDNEELSVKVYWQQVEFVKFNIRRLQKLAQIFEFFSKRECVPADKLLFTLRGRVLQPHDTPDSVQYNIGLFIDGGVLNYSIASLGSKSSNKENKVSSSGIKLKFQCQNAKRPFETSVELDEKLSLAMLKCAEYFELPYAKLRFVLDGEPLAAASTAADAALEPGDCIDVILLQ